MIVEVAYATEECYHGQLFEVADDDDVTEQEVKQRVFRAFREAYQQLTKQCTFVNTEWVLDSEEFRNEMMKQGMRPIMADIRFVFSGWSHADRLHFDFDELDVELWNYVKDQQKDK